MSKGGAERKGKRRYIGEGKRRGGWVGEGGSEPDIATRPPLNKTQLNQRTYRSFGTYALFYAVY